MPPAASTPPCGFQAFILCGPGASLGVFASNPEEHPKALIPVANRPMLWYPLEWCYRMGITNINLVTPPSSRAPIEAALAQNPYLTALPAPKPNILTPPDLSFTTGTSEILRLSEVQDAIVSDFVLLPCDLICELPGETLLSTWLVNQAALDGTSFRAENEDWWNLQNYMSSLAGVSGERGGRRGAMGVWYAKPTKEENVIGDVSDFIAVAKLADNRAPILPNVPTHGTLEEGPDAQAVAPNVVRSNLHTLIETMPMDTLRDKMSRNKGYPVRAAALKKHGKIKMLTGYRDAHIYVFPHWVKRYAAQNEKFTSVSEDLIGWWAKAEWQTGLSAKLGLDELFLGEPQREEEMQGQAERGVNPVEAELDLQQLSSTKSGNMRGYPPTMLAEREKRASRLLSRAKSFAVPVEEPQQQTDEKVKVNLPPVVAYLHPSDSTALIRRVDNVSLLLATNLRLARLPAAGELPANSPKLPFAHAEKIKYPGGIAGRSQVSAADCLVDASVTVGARSNVKECVIGLNCKIGSGVRLTRCLLMENVVIEDKCSLTGCIVGKRARVGRDCILKECEIQDGNVVEEETEAAGEKFMVFGSLEDGNDFMEEEEEEDDDDDDDAFEESGDDSE